MARSGVPLQARLAALAALGERLDRAAPEDAPAEALAAVVAELGLTAGWMFVSPTIRGDPPAEDLSLAASHGLPPALAADDAAELRCGSCECQGRFRKGLLDGGTNMVTCSRLAAAEGDTGGLELHASVPLSGRGGPLGILNLAAPGDRRFTDDELSFLAVVGRQLGAALERTRLAEARTRAARFGAALEERARLAREMHDSLSQLLFAAGLQLGLAKAGRTDALAEAETLLADARSELRASVEANRSPDLTGGLPAALGRLAERMSAIVDVHLDLEDVALSDDAQAALYRCAQEAVHNAVRHGRAAHVRVALRASSGSGAELTIEDDGRGGDPGRVSAGSGVRGLRERAESLGGTLHVAAADAGGVSLRVRLPGPGRGP